MTGRQQFEDAARGLPRTIPVLELLEDPLLSTEPWPLRTVHRGRYSALIHGPSQTPRHMARQDATEKTRPLPAPEGSHHVTPLEWHSPKRWLPIQQDSRSPQHAPREAGRGSPQLKKEQPPSP